MNKKRKPKNNELKKLKSQTRKKELINWSWILTILIISFVLSVSLSFISEISIKNTTLLISIIVTLIFIFLGILFDIIGVSVTASDEKIFHSMSSRKVRASKVAVKFKKNADKVSSFCCDVIGDICGVISGASGIAIVTILVKTYSFSVLLTTLIVTGIISSLTIGGKALGKSFTINKSNIILYEFAKVVSIFYKGE